ncbi:MAG: hypothetical protein E7185_02610 [Erysipelotrichaceae bacterium]|nr:hypothetical protein [Erysipelotrichaceae bacterium]
MSRTALFISIIALVLAVLGYFLLRKRSAESPDRVGKYSAGQYMGIIMMGLILCMAALCICVLLARQVSNADVVTDLLSMQGITLTITGTAIAMVTIVTAVQNYDREKKDKELEERILGNIEKKMQELDSFQSELQELFESSRNENRQFLDQAEEEMQKQTLAYENLRKDLSDNVRVLFDCNSEDDVHLRIRIENYRKLLKENPSNLNVGLALIDALARRANIDADEDQMRENDEIIFIADSFMTDKENMEPLEWINLDIKKANACYSNGRLCVDSVDPKEREKAAEYFQEALNIFNELLVSNDVPKELTGYLHGYLGLCFFWKYKSSDNKDLSALDESIRHYEQCVLCHPNDAKMLNSLAVSKQNRARQIPDKQQKIKQLLSVRGDYTRAIAADPRRQKSWLNIASINADVVHMLLNIDIRKPDIKIVQPDEDTAEQIRDLCDEGIEHIEKAMMINPGLIDLYHKYADLALCKAIVSPDNDRPALLAEAKKRIEYGELLDRDNKQLQYARNLFKAVSNKESVV